MKRLTKEQQRIQQEDNELACEMFGHLPQPSVKPQSFGEMHSEMSMSCSRCGDAL